MPVSEVVATGSSVSSLSEAVSSTGSDSLTKQKVGRPKGSTKEKKVEEASRYKICVNEIVDSYVLEVNSRKARGISRCAKGFLDNLIEEKKKEHIVSGKN